MMMNFSVKDKSIRGILIGSAEKIEPMIANAEMQEVQLTMTPFYSPWGLQIDVTYNQPAPGKPIIIGYTYSLDTAKFHNWVQENAYLMDSGPLVFSSRGIQVAIPSKEDWSLAMFSIDNEEGKPIPLPLNQVPAQFNVHRDIFHGKEWEVIVEYQDGVAPDREVNDV